jgi:hypothetical protein
MVSECNPGGKALDQHRFFFWVDRNDLMQYVNIHIVFALEKGRIARSQFVRAFHPAADIVGHTAAGIGDKAVPFFTYTVKKRITVGVVKFPPFCSCAPSTPHHAIVR